jgi:hypothetical protein
MSYKSVEKANCEPHLIRKPSKIVASLNNCDIRLHSANHGHFEIVKWLVEVGKADDIVDFDCEDASSFMGLEPELGAQISDYLASRKRSTKLG